MLDYYGNITEFINYSHTCQESPIQADFHLHDRFEIYYFISGNIKYFIEKKVYSLKPGDLLLMNSHEIHKPSYFAEGVYERIVIHFEPSLVHLLNSPSFNLLNCYLNRPLGEKNYISLNLKQQEKIMQLFSQLEALGDNTANGSDVLRLSIFLEILVFINRIFSNTLPSQDELVHVPERLVPILDYINANLENDLSLVLLEQHFYINRFYLTRLFKKFTNSSLHEYILYKRVSRAKQLLADGYSVTETCSKSGFNDYSNFLRIFKRTVGMTPGRYRKTIRQNR